MIPELNKTHFSFTKWEISLMSPKIYLLPYMQIWNYHLALVIKCLLLIATIGKKTIIMIRQLSQAETKQVDLDNESTILSMNGK